MNKKNIIIPMAACLLALAMPDTSSADNIKILAADFQSGANQQWTVSVTLMHSDTGWDHYADNWRIVDAAGKILGDRVLYHPHVKEQPFTRSLDKVKIPEGTTKVYIEAHDKIHGWTPNRLNVDLTRAIGGQLRVEAK